MNNRSVKTHAKSLIFLFIILIILGATTVVLIFSLKTDTIGDLLKSDEIVNILLVLHDNGEPISTNVLIYYPVSKRGALIDIPGNTGAIYRSLNRVDGIDRVYVEKGISVYKEEIENLIGKKILFTLEFSLEEFATLTDLFGGLRIFIPSPVDIANDEGKLFLLPSGAVLLDGHKIKSYLTLNIEEESVADKRERQQNAWVAFFSALNNNRSLIFTKKVFPFYSKLVTANVNQDGLYKLLAKIAEIDAERLPTQSVLGSSRKVDDKTLLFPSYDGQLIKDVFNQTSTALISASGQVASRIYVIELQNGTTIDGLARNTGIMLRGSGWDVQSEKNADRNNYEKTVIIDHIDNETEAQILADFIHCKNIIKEDVNNANDLETESLVDFTIILGKDFDGRYVR